MPRIDAIAKWDEPASIEKLETYMKGLVPFYNPNLPQSGDGEASEDGAGGDDDGDGESAGSGANL